MRIASLLVLFLTVPACDEPPSSSSDSSPACLTTGEPLSLPDTFHQLRACLAARSYRAMEPYIDEVSRDDEIEMLIAVDELLAANSAVLQAAKKVCPDMDVQSFDLSLLADNLGLLSRDVEYVDSKTSGDCGIVTAKVSNRLPLDDIEFIRKGDHWMYAPGPSDPTVTPTIREIAEAMDRIVLVISTKPVTPEDIREEYRLRVSPKIRRLMASVTAAAPGEE